jgi:hypothetical protein
MPLDPMERRLHAAFLSFLNHFDYNLDDIPIIDVFVERGAPVIPAPVLVPHSHAIDAVFAISVDGDLAMIGGDFERAKDGGQLGAVVGLAGAGERLRDVPASCQMSLDRSTAMATGNLPGIFFAKVYTDAGDGSISAIAQCATIRVDAEYPSFLTIQRLLIWHVADFTRLWIYQGIRIEAVFQAFL